MVFIIYISLCILAAAIAGNKGRSILGFFVLSLLLSPLIGIIAALIARPNIKEQQKKQIATGEMKKCPYCAETIKAEATICRYCQKEQPPRENIQKDPLQQFGKKNIFGINTNDTSVYEDIAARNGLTTESDAPSKK